MPVILFVAFFLLFNIQTVDGQSWRNVDSLLLYLENAETQYEKGKILIRLSRYSNIEKASSYAEQAIEIGHNINDLILVADGYEELSLINRKLGNTIEAFTNSFEALKIYQSLERKDRIAGINEQIGSHYLYDKNTEKAILYLRDAFSNYVEINDTLDIALTAINLGEAFRVANLPDSAAYYFELSLEYEKLIGRDLVYAYGIGNLGLVHSAQNRTELALSELNEANDILIRLNDPYAASYYQSEIGKIFVNQGKYIEGEQLLLTSLEKAKEVGLKEQIKDISKILSEHYERQALFDKALFYRKQYESFADSLQNLDNVRQIEGLRADQAIDQKQKEVEYLDQINASTKKLNLVLGIGLLGLTSLSFLLYYSFRKLTQSHKVLEKQKKVIEKREEEKALLLRELNHRVKNNLQMIASLLNLQSHQIEDKEASKALESGKMRVEALSLIHQKLYSKDHHTTIRVKEYMEELVKNLVFTFMPDVSVKFDIEDIAMDIDKAIPLGLVINELCTNALKYAFNDHQSPKLAVSLIKRGRNYLLDISDNGIGMHNNKDETSSFGLRLVNSLIDQMDADISQLNRDGCTWKVSIPL